MSPVFLFTRWAVQMEQIAYPTSWMEKISKKKNWIQSFSDSLNVRYQSFSSVGIQLLKVWKILFWQQKQQHLISPFNFCICFVFSGTCNVVGFFLPISFFAQKFWSGIARTCYEFSLCTFDFDCQIIVKCKSDCIIFYSQKKLRKVCILCAQSMWNQNIFFIVELWKLFRLEITVFFRLNLPS
jgi:hypothetical protein